MNKYLAIQTLGFEDFYTVEEWVDGDEPIDEWEDYEYEDHE